MERIAVQSSNIRSIGYEHDTGTLEVEFSSGGIYQYAGVTPELHNNLMKSGSKGRFFGSLER